MMLVGLGGIAYALRKSRSAVRRGTTSVTYKFMPSLT